MQIPVEKFTDPNLRVIYSVTAGDWCAYVGNCPFVDFPRLLDARRIQKLNELFTLREALDAGLKVTVLGFETSEERAYNIQQIFAAGLRASHEWISEKEAKKQRRKRESRPVRCVDTGEEFESAAEAARMYHVNPGNLSNHLNGGLSKCGGYTFEYC